MGQKTKVVLVGHGNMGRNHLRTILANSNLELVAVVDPSPKISPQSLPEQAKVFQNIADVDLKSFDAAIVATPTSTHFNVASKLIEAGKHLLVEKPLATTVEDCEKLTRLAKERKKFLGVSHVERFNPVVGKVKEIISQGWLGETIHFNFTRVGGYPSSLIEGNNVLLDLAVHDLDVLRYLVGPLQLQSSICHSTWRPNVLDTAEILVAADSGASASIHVNWVTPTKIRTLRVTGTRGVLFADYILQTCSLLGGNLLDRSYHDKEFNFDQLTEFYRNSDRVEFGVIKEEPLKLQCSDFVRSIQGEPSKICSGEEAREAVALAEQALKQSQVGIQKK